MVSRKTGIMVLAGVALAVSGVIVAGMLLAAKPSIIQINEGTFKIIELPYTYTKNDAYILVIGSAIGGMMLSYILIALYTAGWNDIRTAAEEPVKFPVLDDAPAAELVVNQSDYDRYIPHVSAYEGHIKCRSQNFTYQNHRGDPLGNENSHVMDAVLTALEGDEKKLVKEIADHGGEMLQNELVLSLNFSKAKVSRMLADLEKRGLVVKKQYGLTNKVALADKLRGEKNEK